MDLVKFLLLYAIFSILPGQLIRITVGSSSAITLSDVFVGLCDIAFLIYWLLSKKTFKLPRVSYFFALFVLWALASTTLAVNFFSFTQIAVAASFLARFVAYFFLTIVTYNVIEKKSSLAWTKVLLLAGLLFTFAGFLQILIFPDLSFLTSFGWDPHKSRIASTLLDPNFTGGLTTIFFSLATSLFIFKKKIFYAAVAAIFFAAIILTFSRSSYLAFLAAILVIGLAKSPKVLIVSLVFFIIAIASITQVRTRIVGALTFDETAAARVESWRRAIEIFAKNPIFGVGFNTYRFAQAKSGNFDYGDPQGGHSGAGSDSSILLVAATTGIFGTVLYLGFLFSLLQIFVRNLGKNYLSLAGTASLIALFVHSQFVNSLFFPQIMLILFFIAGLSANQE